MVSSALEISSGESDDDDGSSSDDSTAPMITPRAKVQEDSSWSKKWIILISLAVVLYLILDSVDIGSWKVGTDDYNTYKELKTPSNQQCDYNVGMNQDGSLAPVDSGGGDNDYWPTIPKEHWGCMPRTFEPATFSWCGLRRDYDRDTPAGLILVKVHKAASSTLAGVNLRIAHHYGNCASKQFHQDSRVYANRERTRSFMYSSIRHPVHRAISWIFYTASNRGQELTDDTILQRLKARNFYVRGGNDDKARNLNDAGAQAGYMNTNEHLPQPLWRKERPNVVGNFTLAATRVQEVMQQYDFIAIVERLPESLVVLQLLLDLKTTDILYLSAKKSGGYSFNFRPNPGCHKLVKSYISPKVQAYLSSPEWYAQNYQDYLLYKAANASLDRTIDALGRERFQTALKEYQDLMVEAKQCESEAIFPCSEDGVHNEETNCYENDWGCGYPCLDRRFGK